MYAKETCMELDGVGFSLHHDSDGQQYDKEFIRRHGALRTETWTLVEAEDITGAIRKIKSEWYGCNIGGGAEKAKALWINRDKPIQELPQCPLYWVRENKGDVVCGKPNKNDQYCGCGFGGFDFAEGCIGDKFCEKIGKEYDHEKETWVDKVPPNIITVDGLDYKFITWRSI
jgi:hypothetical protein